MSKPRLPLVLRQAHVIARYFHVKGDSYIATYQATLRLSRWDFVRCLAIAEGRIAEPCYDHPRQRRRRLPISTTRVWS